MKKLTEIPRNLRVAWVPMTLVVLVMALLIAAAATANQALAIGPDTDGNAGSNTDPFPNLSTYDDPQPCGPGAGTAFMEEPHEITTGHYALFDAYWRTISTSTVPASTGSTGGGQTPGPGTPGPATTTTTTGPGVGVLHTNECPPEMIQATTTVTVGRETKTVTTTVRSARDGGMDIEEAIIHVLDKHLATTVDTNAEAIDGQLSLEEYPDVANYAPAGSQVWWLRLDDPGTTSTDETSDLGMGFSTLLLDEERWHTSEDEKPLRYRFEVERHPADPTDVPHFFAYEAPNASSTPQDPVWDSSKPGEGVVELDPGEYKELQWVFTKPGTYLMWVHLLGVVKQPGANDDWNAISSNETETSEVYQYTIQVGTDLDETEPPIFGVNLEVEENSLGGVEVGDPIPIYNAEADVLYYDLTGPGHSNFDLLASSSTAPHTVQIVVADGADLDYETEEPYYELHLSVTDKVDHESNFNPYPDDVMIVRIDLTDQAPGLTVQADTTDLDVHGNVKFTAVYEPTEEDRGFEFGYGLAEFTGTSGGEDNHALWSIIAETPIDDARASIWSAYTYQARGVTKVYRVYVKIPNHNGGITPTFLNSDYFYITRPN